MPTPAFVYGPQLADTDPALPLRRWARRRCLARPVAHVLARAPYRPFRAAVLDISAGGVGLVCERPLEPGTQLSLQLRDSDGHNPSPVLLASVAHATERSDGSWLVGCQFRSPLSTEELLAIA